MTWFKVDDNFWSHPKTVALSTDAVALWVRAGSYCGNHLTDGVVPRYVLPMLQGDADAATELVDAGLWLDHIDGWVFHDWEQYQPARAKVEAERAKTRERVAKHRAKESDTSLLEEKQPVPDPTRPRIRVSNGVTPDVTFDDFWSAYPRKAGKGAAKTAWTKAVSKASAADIIAAAKRYRDDPNREDGFTAHAATWLNGERWDDDPLPSRAGMSTSEQRLRRNVANLAAMQTEVRLTPLEESLIAEGVLADPRLREVGR